MEEFRTLTPKPASVLVNSVLDSAVPSTGALQSKIEQAILNSSEPLPLPESEIIDINGIRGILVNKDEVANWNGPVPITQFKINHDPNPEVVRKPNNQTVEYNQDISVRYLRPPTPTGEILIRRKDNHIPVLAPPHIVRIPGCRPSTPPPVIFRETPPEYRIESKQFVVPGKTITDLPDRRLVVEKLPSLPQKPPQIIIEKWF